MELVQRLRGFGTTIFTEMTQLALEHGAVNLGQGFPDFDAPEFVREAAREAIRAGRNQYCRMFGLPELNRAVARHRERFHGLRYDPDREITVFAGATEALFATIVSLCEAGDEVVLFEPAYDSYRPALAVAGAVPRPVPLLPPRFALDPAALERALSPRTRAILLNSPHNPTGKVFTTDELESIAELCRKRDLLAITDEVYEHITFGVPHVPLAKLPGMRGRTVMISSAGKTFSATGWKIGYACAPEALTRALRSAHQFITFCVATPLQAAIAVALAAPDSFFAELGAQYAARRERLCRGLAAAGLAVLEPEGTYFVCCDIRPLGFEDDLEFCRALPARAGVAAIPVSAFIADRGVRHLARFAFCKTDAALDEGIRRLAALP
ncbi:MAG: aminotransferase class I/II-fold pyridoxal phosphate-dependent enzyme [Acidobacteria bacterium]|nr:aminotransferase class I/II-fold pyridoxal phosphate-dependent enzyme [Acidobacteriota bacterium]